MLGHGQPHMDAVQQSFTDPKNLHILVIDSRGPSRQSVCQLLRECSYQVTAVKTSREGVQLLLDAEGGFDLILKEHEPPGPDACRLLRRLAKADGFLQGPPPVVVMSSKDNRETVMSCLTLGAIDYLIKPLRQNELRHIWTRVWWWRKSQAQGHALPVGAFALGGHGGHNAPHRQRGNSYEATSSDSKDTKW